MTQSSRPQAGNCSVNPAYVDAGPWSRDEWAERIYTVLTGDDTTASTRARLRGVIPTNDNMLVVTNPAGVTITAGTGVGIAQGSLLFNDAAVTFTPNTPGIASRTDKVVIVENNTNVAYDGTASGVILDFPTDLTDYSGAAVPPYAARLAILRGDAATGNPTALIQTAEYWMIELARFNITNVPAVNTLTDYREFANIEKIVGVHSDDNDTIQDALILGVEVNDGVGAAGLGVGIKFRLENSAGTAEDVGQLAIRYTDPAAADETRLELRLKAGGGDNLAAVVNSPTASSVDGNARGVSSVDLQQSRGAVTQVASGDYSVISGGRNCTASGLYSAVAGGQSCVASGDNSFAAGAAEATGDYSMATGYDTYATEDYSVALGGETVSNLYGQVAHASGRFAVNGDAQGTIQLVARTTTVGGGVARTLYLDNNIELPVIPASTGWTYDILIVAISTTAVTHYAAFRAYGMIERDNANNTTLHSVTGVITEAASGGQTVTVTADDVNEALLIQFNDNATTSHRVVATIRLAQVTFPA